MTLQQELTQALSCGGEVNMQMVADALNGTAAQQQKLAENIRLVDRGERPTHPNIPRAYFYTQYDPKFWELGDELGREERDACDAPAE